MLLAALTLAASALAWQPLAQDISYAPTTLTMPAPNMRRVLLKIDRIVTLYEYDCRRKTAAMLYVMRPDREPYAPASNVSTPHYFSHTSVHAMVTARVCGKEML
jgi:hypothetical protein